MYIYTKNSAIGYDPVARWKEELGKHLSEYKKSIAEQKRHDEIISLLESIKSKIK